MNKLVKTENDHLHLTGGYVIPAEVGDNITAAVLLDHCNYLQSEIDNHVENGVYLHPEDYIKNTKLVRCMTYLLDNYFPN